MALAKSEKKSAAQSRRQFIAAPESAHATRIKQGLFQIIRARKAHPSAQALAGAHVEVVIRGKAAAERPAETIRLDLGDIELDQIEDASQEDFPREQPGVGGDALEIALAAARKRGGARAAQILSSANMLSADAFASRLGATRTSVNAWRKSGRVLALAGAKRGFRYPAWQVDRDGRPFQALQRLFSTFGGSAWAVYRFLVQHHAELDGRTGLEALERGDDQKALAAAESVARSFA